MQQINLGPKIKSANWLSGMELIYSNRLKSIQSFTNLFDIDQRVGVGPSLRQWRTDFSKGKQQYV